MNEKLKPYFLLLPAAIVYFGIFLTGIVICIVQSIGYFPAAGLKELTLKYYLSVLKDNDFLSSLKFSIFITVVSSTAAVVVGIILAYLIYRSKNKRIIEKLLYKLPIIVPHMIAALLVYNIFSQSGIWPRLLYNLGLINSQQDYRPLVFDRYGLGIIITYLWKEIPFIAMVAYSVLGSINEKLVEAAQSLGASQKQIFWNILLPLMLPPIISGFIIIIAFSFGAFEVPYLLGPTKPRTLPVLAYTEYLSSDIGRRPVSMAINTILTFLSLIMVLLYQKAFEAVNKNKR